MCLLQLDRYRGTLARVQLGGSVRLALQPLISSAYTRLQAAAENGVSELVTTAQLDWSAEGVPEGAPFELVLAADVLYDKGNARHIAKLLPRLLADGGCCMISDQTQWPWRADFTVACAAEGLVVDDAKLPAPEDVRLLSITRADDQEAEPR